jgi:type III restriction enzyme
MKNKELLLERDPKKSPVRFIFSHSALREGWDNPNVFQICTLKQSGSDVRKRQEVGRGLRLCVNQDGERMDANVLGEDVHNVNVLTVVASESYDDFAKKLQTEIAEAISDRPMAVTEKLFVGRVLKDDKGNECTVDSNLARTIYNNLIRNDYIDDEGMLTDTFREDKKNGTVKVADKVKDFSEAIISILDMVYDAKKLMPEDDRKSNVTATLDERKAEMKEFKELWKQINAKSAYVVDFDSAELVKKSIDKLDRELRVPKIYFKVSTGTLDQIESKETLNHGEAFVKEKVTTVNAYSTITANSSVKYDLVGKVVEDTGLTRKDVVAILSGIRKEIFDQFKDNPEEFIIQAARLINEEKATVIIEHITYNVLEERHDMDIFTEPTLKGRLDVNAMKTKKNLYDHLIYDSTNERKFAEEMDVDSDVAVYVKLPGGFYINTPVGKYNPDWAIAFYEGNVKHIYFVAETKGTMSSMNLRKVEELKKQCAKEHFKAISSDKVVYDVVDSYAALKALVLK